MNIRLTLTERTQESASKLRLLAPIAVGVSHELGLREIVEIVGPAEEVLATFHDTSSAAWLALGVLLGLFE